MSAMDIINYNILKSCYGCDQHQEDQFVNAVIVVALRYLKTLHPIQLEIFALVTDKNSPQQHPTSKDYALDVVRWMEEKYKGGEVRETTEENFHNLRTRYVETIILHKWSKCENF